MTTSDPVVAETVTRLRYDAGLHAVLKFRDVIERAVDTGWLTVRESDGHLRSAALRVMARYDGLPLSYADGVGAVIAEETNAEAVVGLDDDFRVMGFALEPGE